MIRYTRHGRLLQFMAFQLNCFAPLKESRRVNQPDSVSVVALYPAGGKVPVHYNPQNPAEAVIDPVQNTGSRPLVLYAMAMMALGLFAFTGGVYALAH